MPDFYNHFKSVEHISLDLWLTLVRSHPDFKMQRAALLKTHFELEQSLEEVLKELRYYDVTCNWVNELAGGNLDTYEIILLILSRLGLDLKKITRAHLDAFYHKMEDLIMELPPMLIHPGVPEMLQNFENSGFTINLLSNTGFIKGKTLNKILNRLNILQYFSFQVYSDEIGVSKPNKKAFAFVYEEVCKIRDCKKENVLHIGDNEIADVAGARQFGFKSLLVSPGLYALQDTIKK